MSLQQINASTVDEVFRGRVKAAVFVKSASVSGENPGAMKTNKARKRHDLTLNLYYNSATILESFYAAVAAICGEVSDPSSVSDIDITNAVDSVWNKIAGVKFEDEDEQ